MKMNELGFLLSIPCLLLTYVTANGKQETNFRAEMAKGHFHLLDPFSKFLLPSHIIFKAYGLAD